MGEGNVISEVAAAGAGAAAERAAERASASVRRLFRQDDVVGGEFALESEPEQPRKRLRGKQHPPLAWVRECKALTETTRPVAIEGVSTASGLRPDEYVLNLWSAAGGNADPRARMDEALSWF